MKLWRVIFLIGVIVFLSMTMAVLTASAGSCNCYSPTDTEEYYEETRVIGTYTPHPSRTPTPQDTADATYTATMTAVPATETQTAPPTDTQTSPPPTETFTPSPTVTDTATEVVSQTAEPSPTATATDTSTGEPTATDTETATEAHEPTSTGTPGATATTGPTMTATGSATPTATSSATQTSVPSATHTPTAVNINDTPTPTTVHDTPTPIHTPEVGETPTGTEITGTVILRNEGYEASGASRIVGVMRFPSIGRRIAIGLGWNRSDGFHHAINVAGKAGADDYGIHDKYMPELKRLRVGAVVWMDGAKYRVRYVIQVLNKNQATMAVLLDHWATITTCTTDWKHNVVFLLTETLERWK